MKGETIYSSAELPRMELTKSRSINDFEIERVTLVASGWSAGDARKNFEFLLSAYENIVRHKKSPLQNNQNDKGDGVA